LAIAIDEFGCNVIAGTTNRIYYIPDAVPGRAYAPYTWISAINGGGYYLLTHSRCIDDSSIPCTVYKFGSTGINASDVLYEGYYTNIYDCPLENYIWMLFLSFNGFVAYCVIRKEVLIH